MDENMDIRVERGGWRRHVAAAALVALGIAAGASSAQLVSAAPEAPAPELLAQLNAEAGSAWAGRVAIADQYDEVRADQARQARVDRQEGSDRHLQVQADEALRARVARQAGSDRHLELLADQAAAAQVERAAGSDRHLENLAQHGGGRITVR